MITGIKLKNWRSHLNSEIKFSSGTNALLGHMGSGKTTILDSICFALFGTYPILQSKKLKLDDLIMNKPSIKDLAEVEVFFQLSGKNYSVKRIIEKRKGTTYSELREDGRLLEAPSTQRVNELVERILRIDYDLFSKAIYSEQNSLDYFLTIPKGQRMKKMDELLLIDKFEKARSNTVKLINQILERKSVTQSLLDKINFNDLDSTLKTLRLSLTQLITEKVRDEKEIKIIKQKRTTLESELKKLKKSKEDFDTLRRDEKGVSGAIEELSKSLDIIEQRISNTDKKTIGENLKSTSRLLDELNTSLKDKTEEYQKKSDQYSKYKAEAEVYKREAIDRLEKELIDKKSLQKEIENLKKQIDKEPHKELEKRKLLLEKFVGQMEALKIKIDELAKMIEQLSSVKAKCPLCESKLTQEKKVVLIKNKRQQISELREDLEKAYKQKQINEQELRTLTRSIEKLNNLLTIHGDSDKLLKDLQSAKDIYKVLNENSVKFQREVIDLKEKISAIQRKINEVDDSKRGIELLLVELRDYSTNKARIDELSKQRKMLQTHLQEIETSIIGKDIYKMENELLSLVGKEKSMSTKIDSLEPLIFEKESRLKELEATFAKVSKDKYEIQKLDALSMQLKLFEKSLEATQVQLRQEFISAVNYSMDKLWQTIYPYQDYSEIRLNVEEGDYVLQLKSRNNWMNVEGIASGGERSLASLTLRVALSLILAPHLRILFLDEPTANLDSKAITELANTLRERIHEFIDQTFIITHQTELEDAVTGYAYQLERDKSNDEYTQITQLN